MKNPETGAAQVEIESGDGSQTLIVSRKAFELIYEPRGYRSIDENSTDTEESDVESGDETQAAGAARAAKRGRTRSGNKENNS